MVSAAGADRGGIAVDPAIKKRLDLYRSLVLLGPRDECASPDGSMLSFYGDHVVEEGAGSPAGLVRLMFGRDYHGTDVLKMACDCFQLRDGFRLDPTNPLHQRILLLVLAHVVFGVGKRRGRPKDSKNWTDIQYHHLAALYIEIKSKQPKLSNIKIAEVIEKRWRKPKEVIRKRLSSKGLRGWIEYLEEREKEEPGFIQRYGELLKSEKERAERRPI
jgi:hypothetical protein